MEELPVDPGELFAFSGHFHYRLKAFNLLLLNAAFI
jgi:hypothetical protein